MSPTPDEYREFVAAVDGAPLDETPTEPTAGGTSGKGPADPAAETSKSETAGLAVAARELPPFPVDALPADVAAWVMAVAEESQTPLDLAALAALGVLSAAGMGVAVVDCGAWEEELVLYLLVAMPSGDRKSTVLRAAMAPLRELERARRDAAAPAIRELRARRDVLEVRRRKLTKTAGEHANLDTRAEAAAELTYVAEELEEIGEPALPRILADDATPEALGGLLARHGSIAVIATESALIDNLTGRYSDGVANLHLVCSAYHGEATTIDRRGRDPEKIDRPLLTIALVVQPHVLDALVSHQTARAQGFVARFAYALPETQLGRRRIDAARAPRELHDAWARCVRRVANSADGTDKTPSQESSVSSVSTSGPLRIALTPGAATLLHELRAAQEPRLAETGDLRPVADWAARHPGRVARIAGLLHLAQHSATEPIHQATLQNALRIGDYLLTHGLAALTGPDDLTRRALTWLTGRRAVTQRDLQRGPLAGRSTADEAHALADSLVRLGALRPIVPEHRGPGRPSSPAYDVDPDFARKADRTDNTRPGDEG